MTPPTTPTSCAGAPRPRAAGGACRLPDHRSPRCDASRTPAPVGPSLTTVAHPILHHERPRNARGTPAVELPSPCRKPTYVPDTLEAIGNAVTPCENNAVTDVTPGTDPGEDLGEESLRSESLPEVADPAVPSGNRPASVPDAPAILDPPGSTALSALLAAPGLRAVPDGRAATTSVPSCVCCGSVAGWLNLGSEAICEACYVQARASAVEPEHVL